MTSTRTIRNAGVLAAVTLLAVPAAAAAHPSVYATTAQVLVPGSDPVQYAPQERYVVANHGYTFVLKETNGLGPGTRGVVTYGKARGRAKQAGFLDTDAATTGAQAHATCDVPSLTDEATIRSWQGATPEDKGEPFYAYVPFQKGAAGLEDTPSTWIPVVKAATGVDLDAVEDTDAGREAACEAPSVGGTYHPADQTHSTNAAFNSGLVADTKAPFEARITTLEEQIGAARAQAATQQRAAKAAEGRAASAERRAATAEAALAKAGIPVPSPSGAAPAAPKALSATIDARRFTPAAAVKGIPVRVTGPAGQVVRVRVSVSPATAKKRGLGTTTVGKRTVTLGAGGTATVTVRPTASPRKALRKLKTGSVPVEVELIAGTTKATIAR